MSRKIIMAIAWASLAFIVFATLSPIGLRPHLAGVSMERFGAFAVAGLLFGLAYPGRFWLVLAIVLGAAVGLETLQFLTPDRHGELRDAMVKAVGGAFGVGLSLLLNRLSATVAAPQGTNA
ncbi:VanZ family protein [Rhodopseudomonas sp. P2A-2r]|uniref:VanZ family protein n=1 Tax=unclassified Rhodopseudomonas TaxID=2638247 RepID=UPI00223496BA|nr:VanZ family protein [Rhodopseudomonas sp. P2A-2r]UZE50083.1 VanZ family protein [Rhodopseudomonas sp. P2A-2r]